MSGPSHGSPVRPALWNANSCLARPSRPATSAAVAASSCGYGSPSATTRAGRLWAVNITRTMSGSGKRASASRVVSASASMKRGWSCQESTKTASGGAAAPPEAVFVDSWHDQPRFIEALAETTREALARFPDPDIVRVMFTAHSLPARVVAEGDPYPQELAATAALVADRLGLASYDFAFQSAGRITSAPM